MLFQSQPVVIAVSNQLDKNQTDFLTRSLERISRVSPETPVIIKSVGADYWASKPTRDTADFAFCNSREFALLERFSGSLALAEAVPPQAADAGAGTGLTAVALNPSGISGLRNAAEITAWTPVQTDQAYLTALFNAFLASQGIKAKVETRTAPPHDQMARKIQAGHFSPEEVLLLPACTRETELPADSELLALPILESKRLAQLDCRISFGLFPGAVFSSFLGTDDVLKNKVLSVFLAQDDIDGWRWDVPAPRQRVHELMSTYDNRYRQLAQPGILNFLSRYAGWLIAAAVGLLLLFANALFLSWQVRRKTSQIEILAAQRQQALEKAAALEKVSAVSQMSSIVAHEIRQPLTALRTYIGSLRRRLQKKSLNNEDLDWVLSNMRDEVERADAIVEHVRSYAKTGGNNPRQSMDVSAVIQQELCQHYPVRIEASVESGIAFPVDDLEIRLIVRNLLKNACEATAEVREPHVRLTWTRSQAHAVLRVIDNGPRLSPEDFAALADPLHTTKPNGLGLGLPIVKRIAEGYCVGLEFIQLPEHGLEVCIRFPLPNIPSVTEESKTTENNACPTSN